MLPGGSPFYCPQESTWRSTRSLSFLEQPKFSPGIHTGKIKKKCLLKTPQDLKQISQEPQFEFLTDFPTWYVIYSVNVGKLFARWCCICCCLLRQNCCNESLRLSDLLLIVRCLIFPTQVTTILRNTPKNILNSLPWKTHFSRFTVRFRLILKNSALQRHTLT